MSLSATFIVQSGLQLQPNSKHLSKHRERCRGGLIVSCSASCRARSACWSSFTATTQLYHRHYTTSHSSHRCFRPFICRSVSALCRAWLTCPPHTFFSYIIHRYSVRPSGHRRFHLWQTVYLAHRPHPGLQGGREERDVDCINAMMMLNWTVRRPSCGGVTTSRRTITCYRSL